MNSCTFWEKTWLAAHSGEKHGWQHILGKNMISIAAYSGKNTWLAAHSGKNKHDWQLILLKKHDCNTY
jgi:hypothetical protein